ncbi:MAG TPA: phosphoribosylaminoimidazolesuccinocarboxamide synthase [Thermoanaerobaculia bacterium]|nr:phosphoribosylaminoimidazolesuccinocarboxamide synthase [Thermoanaerobaculia bacterium]
MAFAPVTETHLVGARLSRRGKVRELYDLGDSLLLVASDRISAYDCVLSPGIPDKGRILTQLSTFWFRKFDDVENHLIETDVSRFPESLQADAPLLEGRSVIVRKAEVIPFECVARGYLAGSGWSEYRKTGEVCGVRLPPGLSEAERLAEPIFTPATKSAHGHDENVPFARVVNDLGEEEAFLLRDLTLSLYERAREYAESKGLLLADTKLEFGRLDGRLLWIDEAFTPDSSRYWDAHGWTPGRTPISFDKQFVRDWLDSTGWDHRPPAPRLPEGVVRTTREKYLEAYRTLTGSLPAYLSS